MDKERRAFLYVVSFFLGVLIGVILTPLVGHSETWEEPPTTLYVTAKLLNGRARDSKRSSIEARFDQGDELKAFDWSEDHHWIEVLGGETGTVWVWYEYVTEQLEDYTTWWNDWGSKVKIRKEPFGTVVAYLKPGKEVHITQIVLGWGKCKQGWVNLMYLTEED